MEERPIFPVADGVTAIDTRMGGRDRYTAAYLLDADEPVIVETGPTTSVEPVVAGLGSLGIGREDLAHIVLTHIHLDHAGGVGRLASRFPRATIWVHARGAPHLEDPARLLASATRLYGEDYLLRMFGPVDPVPGDRLRALDDGQRLDLGGRRLRILHTPGHAKHHAAIVDDASGAVFTGDALGIHVPMLPILRPATPPPDVDIEAGVESIERIRAEARSVLLFAHFGPVREIDATCDLAVKRLRDWGEVVRGAMETTDDLDEVAAILERETASELRTGADAPLDLERLEVLSSIRMNAAGLMRYWRKRAEREAQARAAAGGDGPQAS